MATAKEIAIHFGGPKARHTSGGWWTTLCPCHSDTRTSLSIRNQSEKNKLGIYCFAGCDYYDIMNEIGNVFPEHKVQHSSQPRPPRKDRPAKPKPQPQKKSSNLEWCPEPIDPALLKVKLAPGFTETARYPWHDQDGRIIMWVIRVEKDGQKEFLPYSVWKRKKSGEAVWIKQSIPINRPLYDIHLDDGSKPILFVEGEKCVEKAKAIFGDFFWVTTAGNSSLANVDFSTLNNRNVLVFPDMDSPGYKMAAKLAEISKANIWILTLPPSMTDYSQGFDICDIDEDKIMSFKTSVLSRKLGIWIKLDQKLNRTLRG
jgi:Domain of unknown function (DUF6371)